MNDTLNVRFKKILETLNKRFDQELDLQGVLFLIGIQELGKGYISLNKNQKLEVIHIAVCALLSQWGYYEFSGHDEEGWPHWKETDSMPNLTPKQQETLIKQAIIEYFD